MLRGIGAYDCVTKRVLPQISKETRQAIQNGTEKAASKWQQLVVLPGVVAGTYIIKNVPSVKCGPGCSDFECDWQVYTTC